MATKDANKAQIAALKNVVFWKATDSGSALTYGTAVPYKNVVEATFSPEGESADILADDVTALSININSGYSIKLTNLYMTPEVEALLFGREVDANGGIAENVDDKFSDMAMAFEFTGDANNVRHVFYNVSFQRNELSGKTKDKAETINVELSGTAKPDPYTGDVKYKMPEGGTGYDAWFTKPVMKASATSGSTSQG